MAGRQKQQSLVRPLPSRRRSSRSSRQAWTLTIGSGLLLLVGLFLWQAFAAGTTPQASSSRSTLIQRSPGHLGGFHQVAEQAQLVDGQVPVLFVSAQYCVFCAAERWALVDALARFGSLSHIGPSQSAAADGFSVPIPTYDFTQAQYASPVVDFQHVDIADGAGRALQHLTSEQQAILNQNDPQGGIPFLIIGGKFAQVSAGYSPAVLEGRSFAQVQQALKDPNSLIAQLIHAEGTRITALICEASSNTPTAACQDAAVQAALAHVW